MKKVICVLMVVVGGLLVTSFTYLGNVNQTAVSNSDFCDGWEDGYCEGWRDVKGQFAICPITPICPIARVGQDRYRDGYNRGFRAGSGAAERN